eukprot:CAMPEP_0169122286 /NCGR_PEP_ID=MMETSP1015-20121227/33138_1 /TAXON_ID=342587 /ORGANISM="Karlodinium micrum, Strain CCMP2283" /LENGTH=559 /DNA_ID=CAMNT_0009185481 /DNA_START=41 /DNA_END=1720 /DNA_ORIENTATION=-
MSAASYDSLEDDKLLDDYSSVTGSLVSYHSKDLFSDESDAEDDTNKYCVWTARFSESVYDDGMLRILRWRQGFEKRGMLGGSCQLAALLMLVACNFALQWTVVLRVITLVDLARQRDIDRVFRPKGACVELEASAFDFISSNFSYPQDNYWVCGPYLPLVMSSVDLLDVNKDEKWSKEDDLASSEKKWIQTFRAHGGKIETVFQRTMEDIKQGNFRYQIQNGLSDDRTKELTEDYTSIPMKWMHDEQNLFQMCNVLNKDLCGNLELRGSLRRLYTTPGFGSADRVNACRETLDRCQAIFGEVFRSYRFRAEESCGAMGSSWNGEHLVIVNRFDDAERYDDRTNPEGITTTQYEVFLLLVLIIWWLAVIQEMRAVMSWWIVLLTVSSQGGSVLKEDDESLEILSVSWCHKLLILFFINLPRTVIIVVLGYIGTEFLIVADSYTDLILNSVALGFLIEVDEMLFAGVTSEGTKKTMGKLDTLKGKHVCCSCCLHLGKFPTSIPYMMVVVFLAAWQGYNAYVKYEGKFMLSEAYRCLCHAEGARCVASQLVGGDLYLDAKYI